MVKPGVRLGLLDWVGLFVVARGRGWGLLERGQKRVGIVIYFEYDEKFDIRFELMKE